jgi:predicted peptidase
MGYSTTGWYGANGPGRPVGTTSVGELSEKDVIRVLDRMKEEFKIDERRIDLAGHSMGGAGALFLGIKHKDVWAAAQSIGGQSPFPQVCLIWCQSMLWHFAEQTCGKGL